MATFKSISNPMRAERASTLGSSLYERFKDEPDTLIVPVIDDDHRPVGLIERHVFSLRMAAEYGRALYARRPISFLMDEQPLVVDADASIEDVTAAMITSRSSDLLRGVVVAQDGRYLGVVTALELLSAAHAREIEHSRDLAEAGRRLALANADAEQARAFMTSVVENIPAMVFVKDPVDHRFILLNKAGEEMFGWSRDAVIGKNGRQLFPADIAADYEAQDAAVLHSGQASILEDERLTRPDGSPIILRTRKLAIHNSGGQAEYLLGISEDITERRKAEAQIVHLAHYDALTQLPNRVLFRKELQEVLGRSRRTSEPVAVLCIDLDHFKNVNDTLGHPAGDALLQSVAHRLRACVRDEDSVARLGGDEFAVVQSGPGLPQGAAQLATRIVDAMAAPFEVLGHQVVIGASVGIALSPNDARDPDDLLKKADMALYRVKSEGRGGLHFFEQNMDEQIQVRRALELDLRKALVNGEFELFFQPLMDVASGEVGGCEALLRWRSPERGLVSPGEFIPLAEEIGLIIPLGDWVLREACAQAVRWPGSKRLAVNISPVQFRNANLVGSVTRALAASGLAAGRLEVEITESVLLQDSAANIAVLHSLRDLGVRVSMDDFGTGYSSLSYLRSFPFDKIKIDQSFVRDLPHDTDALAIIRAVTSMGASLGMSTTAEGVETQAQMDELRRQGCNEIQGFLIGRPMPADEVAAMLGAEVIPKPAGGEVVRAMARPARPSALAPRKAASRQRAL